MFLETYSILLGENVSHTVVTHCLATLAVFSIGTYLSWSSSVFLLYDNEVIKTMSYHDSSWSSSLLPLGAVSTIKLSRLLADRFGRKKTIWATALVLFSCWYVIGFTQTKLWIFLARFAAGAACGAASVVVPMFVSEIIEQNARGLLGIVFQLQITTGILFTYVTAFTESQSVIAILCSIVPALLLISFLFVSESPVWLVMQGRKNEANDALRHFRGSNYNTEAELTRLEICVSEMRESRVDILDLRNYQRETYIILGLMVFQQLSGVSVLIFYTQQIFFHISFLNSVMSAVIFGAVQVIATCFSTILIRHIGKKLLLFISTTVTSVCMFTLSGYFFFDIFHGLSSVVPWLPLLVCAIFIASFSVGSGPIPWMLIDEMFTNKAKNAAYSASAICIWSLAFLVTKFFQNTMMLIGVSSTFAAFGMIHLIGIIFISLMIPERKSRSPEEIQIELCRIQMQELREKERSEREAETREC